jgi:hypothetical protein
MSDNIPKASNPTQLRARALSRWENEGGATACGERDGLSSGDDQSDTHPLTNSELVQLRVRVIALENMVISLLARSCERQLDHVRELATYISPRPGSTPHHLTIRAAAGMNNLVERAWRLRDIPPL